MTQPTHLHRLFLENEPDYSPEAPPKKRTDPLYIDVHRLAVRVRAVITYAQGHCQNEEVKALLEPLETYAASKVGDMSTTIDDAVLDVAEFEADSEQIVSSVEQLEAHMHKSRPADNVDR